MNRRDNGGNGGRLSAAYPNKSFAEVNAMSPDERQAEKGRLLDEYHSLDEEYRLLIQKAKRFGAIHRAIADGLELRPELLFVAMPEGRTIVPSDDKIILSEYPAGLPAIEQLTDRIRFVKGRLSELRATLRL